MRCFAFENTKIRGVKVIKFAVKAVKFSVVHINIIKPIKKYIYYICIFHSGSYISFHVQTLREMSLRMTNSTSTVFWCNFLGASLIL